MNSRPEFELLLCCARTGLDSANSERARELLRGGLDWDYFLSLSWRHGLMPLVNQHLLTSFAELVPDTHLKKIREDFQHNAARNLLLTTELCRVLKAFEGQGVAAVAYKGPALALQVYGDLKLRSFVDLDVLVRRRDIARAGLALEAEGFRPHLRLTPAQEAMLSRSECDRVYLKEGRNLVLELHWAVAPPYFSVPLETEDLLKDLSRVSWGGEELKVPAPEVTLLLLALNGTKDLWAGLETVCAVSELVRACPGLDWERAARLAREKNALRMLLLGLDLAHKLLGAPLPGKILDEIKADRKVGELAREVRGRLAADGGRAPGFWEETRFRVRARERWRDRVRYCALRFLTPTYNDCAPELPRPLSFVYYGLRPLRLLRDGLKRATTKPVV